MKTTRFSLAVGIAACVFFASGAQLFAQSNSPAVPPQWRTIFDAFGAAAQAWLPGMGDALIGQQWGRAAHEWEDARSQYIDNESKVLDYKDKKAQTFWNNRLMRINFQRAIADARCKQAKETVAHRQEMMLTIEQDRQFCREYRERQLAERRANCRVELTESFDWPDALEHETFADCRAQFESLRCAWCEAADSRRVKVGKELARAAKSTLAELKKLAKTIPCDQFLEAKRFLDDVVVASENVTLGTKLAAK